MSFELPRRAPKLRFADSAPAMIRARPAAPPTLARARPKTKIPERMPVMLPPPVSRADVYMLEPEPTAAFDGAGGVVIGHSSRASISDAETLMVDVAAARAAARNPLPVPHFRSAEAIARAVPTTPRAIASPRPRSRLPMLFWVLTAIVAGVISYHFAPTALEHAESAVGMLSR